MNRKRTNGWVMAGSERSGGKRNRRRGGIRRRIVALLALLIAGFAVFFLYRQLSEDRGRTEVGRVTRVATTLKQQIRLTSDRVLFYDGATLHCVSPSGSAEWSYQVGANAAYSVNGNRIAAWSGNDVYIMNDRGRLIYNNRMEDAIQFASVGEEFAAVFTGEIDTGIVMVINAEGQTVDKIQIDHLTLLNIGFFKASTSASGTQKTEIMWILGINTTGTVIETELQTYQPGRLSIGRTNLGEHLAYKVYDDGNGNLNVVNTREIQHYNYRGVSGGDPTLIYGYIAQDIKWNGSRQMILLLPESDITRGMQIESVRFLSGTLDRMLRLPGSCMDARLGSRCIYAFGPREIYACRFEDTTFTPFAVPITITGVIGMLSDNRAVVTSENDIYVIEMPM